VVNERSTNASAGIPQEQAKIMAGSKLQVPDDYFHSVTVPSIVKKKRKKERKKKVQGTKNDRDFNRYDCRLCRNKARLSVSQMFVTVTK